ncbi:MAG: hypothetical protein ACE5D8_03445, partial [Fidelibacterota bacterium]
MRKNLLCLLFSGTILLASEPREPRNYVEFPTRPAPAARVGDYPFPTNPMNDRARGYLLQGKVKNALGNYGNFIDWDVHPAGLWGNYTYLPHVAFVAGVPGQMYSSDFTWDAAQDNPGPSGTTVRVYSSKDAYNAWFDNGDTVFVGVVFEYIDDRGIPGVEKFSKDDIDEKYQWGIDDVEGEIFLSVEYQEFNIMDPNKSRSRIGLIYPWAMRPRLVERTDDFDVYDYGPDKEEWTADDDYMFYGATVSESWFTRYNPSTNTDWQASTKSREFTHNTDISAGDIFGDTPFTDPDDPFPLLAHSTYSQTWPKRLNEETGNYEHFWPGWWAEDYYGDRPEEWPLVGITDCDGNRKDPDCWKEVPGRFISDTDVYMEFDDRWAHRGNIVNTNNEYEQTGYPMGLRVMAEAHSYGVAYAEDIMFVTVKVRNESGDWIDEDGVFHDGMIMPDGTKLNHGKGFNYRGVVLGFYMDADAASTDINGSFWPHTNDDDFMEYYDCLTDPENPCTEINGEKLRVSMAMIYDKDGNSNGATDLGIVATQLLDSPLSTREIDLDKDGTIDIYPGEPLKMTDWHWFDWYDRPGVVTHESNQNCCAGAPGKPVARNREEILYKVISGDTTNISANEKAWYFHTTDEASDLDIDLNPHFDSLEGLEAFAPDGLDCVLIMSCGPFDLKVGEEVPFSFSIIFGQNRQDLINNAKFAQIMYNSHYQGYTPPTRPRVAAKTESGRVTIYWDNAAEQSKDVVTGYSDFEGYKIYKSLDGGATWGTPDKKIYDSNDIFVGWKPFAQYDLSAEEDSLHCIYDDSTCYDGNNRRREVSGPDPHAPWFSLGSNTGLDDIRLTEPVVIDGRTYHYAFVDSNVTDGIAVTYAVTAYDMGVDSDFIINWNYVDSLGGFDPDTVWTKANPDHWSSPDGYASIENSKGTTDLDANFVTVYSGSAARSTVSGVHVVPNPYIVHSRMNETEVTRRLRFVNLPAQATIKIFTVSGEFVQKINHDNPDDGNAWWDLRTENNQEVAP